MTNKVLNLIFKATDKASPVIDDLKGTTGGSKGIGGIASALQGLIGPATIAAGSVMLVGGAVADMMRDWQDHVLGISDFAAVLGISTEEAYALNEIAGDYNITQGDLLTVMERLVEGGLEPTIEGLIAARDIIYESEDPTKRLTTAMDLLGKKGAEELLPMFEDMDAVVADYLVYMEDAGVVTDEMAQEARDGKAAMDDLGGAIEGVKLKAAGFAAPALTAFIGLLLRPFGRDSIAQFLKDFGGAGAITPWTGAFNVTPGGTSGSGAPGGSYYRREDAPITTTAPRVGGLQDGFQAGGAFTIPGIGGPDSTQVSFMGTPGESVTVGGGTSDMTAILAEVRRLVNMLPSLVGDAVERVM